MINALLTKLSLTRDGVISSSGEMRLALAATGNLKVASSRCGSEMPS